MYAASFIARLAERVAQLKVGSGFEAGITQGPLINERAQGAQLLCGGERHALGHGFFQPTVLAGITPAMKVAQEETFGPLAAVFRFETEAQAVHMANDTEFGLAAYCYTRDLGRAWRMSEALE